LMMPLRGSNEFTEENGDMNDKRKTGSRDLAKVWGPNRTWAAHYQGVSGIHSNKTSSTE
jgi:hypothetical protein